MRHIRTCASRATWHPGFRFARCCSGVAPSWRRFRRAVVSLYVWHDAGQSWWIDYGRNNESGARAQVSAPPEARIGHDVTLRYIPGADMRYISGCMEPNSAMVLYKPSNRVEDSETALFLRPRNETK